jgi:hypothetical protein
MTSAPLCVGAVHAVHFTLLLLEKMSKFLLLRHQGFVEYWSVCCPAGSQEVITLRLSIAISLLH